MFGFALQMLPRVADRQVLAVLPGETLWIVSATFVGILLGLFAGLRFASARGRKSAPPIAGFMSSISSTISPVCDHGSNPALDVLQAEHDRLRSELAQRAQQIARLESELSALDAKLVGAKTELQTKIDAAVANHNAALLEALEEAARLKVELTSALSIAAEVPGLRDRLAQLESVLHHRGT